MKVFKFKLQAILNLRTIAKNEALQAYVLSQQKRRALEEQAEHYKEDMCALQKHINNQRQALSAAHDHTYHLEVLEHVQLKLSQVSETIIQAKAEEKAALHYYLELKKSEEMIQKMKHNVKMKHDHAAQLAEQKELEAMIHQRTYTA